MPRQRRPELGLGILLLAHKLYSVGFNTLPPVTLLAVLGQSLLYLGVFDPPWSQHNVCLSGESIIYYKDYRRLILSAIEHVNDIHLYHNMASLLLKGRSLERRYGSLKFLILLLAFTVCTSLTYVGMAYGATEYFQTYKYMKDCAVGFSGVLFALKVVTTYHERNAYQYVHGVRIPAKYAVWVELIIIHLLVPRASFVGHLAGILVGLAYVYGPLGLIVDAVAGMFIPAQPSYTYAHGRATHQQQWQEYPADYRDYGYQDDNTNYNQYDAPQPDPDELRSRRMNYRRYQF